MEAVEEADTANQIVVLSTMNNVIKFMKSLVKLHMARNVQPRMKRNVVHLMNKNVAQNTNQIVQRLKKKNAQLPMNKNASPFTRLNTRKNA